MNASFFSPRRGPVPFCLIFLFLSSLAALAQAGEKEISFEMAFQDGQPELTRTTGFLTNWLDDRFFVWQESDSEKKVSYFKVDAQTGDREPFQRPDTADKSELQKSADGEHEAWLEDGDLYLADIKSNSTRRLTRSAGAETTPRFSPDGWWLAYTRDHDLFAMDLDRGLEVQLTSDGSQTTYNGYSSWVYMEEILGRSTRHNAFWWSPDNSRILFMKFDDSPVGEFHIYHADGNYGELETTRYPKSGEKNPYVKMGVVTLATGEINWLDLEAGNDAYIAWPFWQPDSRSIHVQWLNRDQNHLIIYDVDAQTGSKKAIYEEKQDTWVEFFNDITYLKDGFLLRSDKSGWRHLYLHNMDGSLRKQLTSGDWNVNSILAVDQEKGKVYFNGFQKDTAGLDLFEVGLDGRDLKTITSGFGTHRVELSPGNSFYIDSYSDFKTPRNTSLHKIDGSLVKLLADSANPEISDYKLGEVEFFTIPTTDGYQMPAWWVIPKDLDRNDASRKFGVIFRIYSGPEAPTVRNSYSRSWKDHWYADNGIITISVDHRASGHFGKKGVNAMYRNLGKWELHDLIKAVEWLRQQPFIDPTRIGITGHSYGGYMTLLALAKGGDYFTHGVAGAPVTDWSLYDSVYTERYMDTPQDNPEGYAAGSILANAAGIKGELRLIHGDIDDNVHLQNSTKLVDILTRNNFQFEFMVYPGSRHGIRQYKHRETGENIFWFKHFLHRDFKP